MITKDAPEAQGTPTDLLEVVLLADAGWYAAPGEPDTERYWTGSTWSDDRRPAGAAHGGGLLAALGRAFARRSTRSTEPATAQV